MEQKDPSAYQTADFQEATGVYVWSRRESYEAVESALHGSNWRVCMEQKTATHKRSLFRRRKQLACMYGAEGKYDKLPKLTTPKQLACMYGAEVARYACRCKSPDEATGVYVWSRRIGFSHVTEVHRKQLACMYGAEVGMREFARLVEKKQLACMYGAEVTAREIREIVHVKQLACMYGAEAAGANDFTELAGKQLACMYGAEV